MKCLDLFCGTKSFTKIAEKKGYECDTLDILESFNPTFCCDIMEWDYKQIPQGTYDIIWSSPNCKDYSKMNFICNKMDKDLTYSNNLIKRVLEIFEYFKPKYWFLENPQTGKLKDQEFMDFLPFQDVDYCKYGYDYRKRTRIWTNNILWNPRPLCRGNNKCDKIVNGRHVGFNHTAWNQKERKLTNWEQRISIPPQLIEEIIDSC